MTASAGSLTYRLRRLLPVAGCEEDSVSFEEESFSEVSPHLYEGLTPEAWPGSYALALRKSDSPNGQLQLRMEHCLMVGEEERLRIVQHAGQGVQAVSEILPGTMLLLCLEAGIQVLEISLAAVMTPILRNSGWFCSNAEAWTMLNGNGHEARVQCPKVLLCIF